MKLMLLEEKKMQIRNKTLLKIEVGLKNLEERKLNAFLSEEQLYGVY